MIHLLTRDKAGFSVTLGLYYTGMINSGFSGRRGTGGVKYVG